MEKLVHNFNPIKIKNTSDKLIFSLTIHAT
jgi:hypothetical protein